VANATPLFELCPTALIFGVWDSSGPRGGRGAKFARASVSEIVGYHAVSGLRTSSRIDPLQILADAGPLFEDAVGGWTLEESNARRDEKGKPVLVGGREGRADRRPSSTGT
jgi:CRISPR-associated protein Csb1